MGYKKEIVKRTDGRKCMCKANAYNQHEKVKTWFRCTECNMCLSILLFPLNVPAPFAELYKKYYDKQRAFSGLY
jgi:hypothetical protein